MSESEEVKTSLRNNVWVERKINAANVQAMQLKNGVCDTIARILDSRGVDSSAVESFVNPTLKNDLPDPDIIAHMGKAASRIADAVQKKEKIAVFGDYDVDGVTSSAMMDLFLRSVGAEVVIKIPDRDDGYGAEVQDVDEFVALEAGLFITVDCGTTAIETARYAKEKKLDMIVVDHHEPGNVLPDALAIVNPKLEENGADNPCRMMAAVGVVFMLVIAISRELRKRNFYTESTPEPDLRQWMSLAAFGTVCDMVPLNGINRLIVRSGIALMAHKENLGMAVLAEVAGVKDSISNYHLSFVLGPRVNAGGRIGVANLGYRLLVSNNRDEALDIAYKLNEMNIKRREIEQDVLLQSIEQIESKPQGNVVLVKGDGWHQGVVGIVAGRLKERYNSPAVVITVDGDNAKGSARSIPGFDLGAVIIKSVESGLLTQGGGHMMAAGFSLETAKIGEFKEELEKKYLESKAALVQYNYLELDGYISILGLNLELLKKMEEMEPYGEGNPEPVFAIENVSLASMNVLEGGHVKCSLRSTNGGYINAIAFRAVDNEIGQFLMKNKGEAFNVAGKASINRYRDRENPQFVILDIMK